MTREVVTVDEETSFKEVASLMADIKVSALPVVDRLTYELDDSPFLVPSDLLIDRARGVRRRTWPDCP